MTKELFASEARSEEHRTQRNTARTERDSALEERDSARIQRDDFMGQTANLQGNQIAQEQFIATLSHDLRNPIGAIKMAAEIIKDSADENLNLEMLALINRNADQAGELISQLLDAHLIRSGATLPLDLERCNVMTTLEKCHQALPPSEQNQITISSAQPEVWGVWDYRALERMFKNLFSNAIKFSDDRGIRITVEQDAARTSVSVQNFGEIISLKNQMRIFDSQVRVQQAESQHKKGWGLGLTLVRGIVEAHHGCVEVSSTVPDGTIFTVRIPNSLV